MSKTPSELREYHKKWNEENHERKLVHAFVYELRRKHGNPSASFIESEIKKYLNRNRSRKNRYKIKLD